MQKKILVLILSLILLIFAFFFLYFSKRIFPNVYINGIPLGGKTEKEAVIYLSQNILVAKEIVLEESQQIFRIPTKDIDFKYDYTNSVHEVYITGRNKNLLTKKNTGLSFYLNNEKLNSFLSDIVGQIAVEPVYPTASIKNNEIFIEKGKPGIDVNVNKLKTTIFDNLKNQDFSIINIEKNIVDVSLNDSQAEIYKNRLNKLVGKTLTLNNENYNLTIENSGLIALVDPKNQGYLDSEVNKIISKTSLALNTDPQNSVIIFLPNEVGNSSKVKEFAPEKNGVKVNSEDLKLALIKSLGDLENSDSKNTIVSISIEIIPAKIKTGDINDLGIKTLIGKGTSKFQGSISSRVYNINLASSKLNGIIIKPGDTFSFNDTLGDISKFTGYKEAYIIKDGKTILGDGGGVCQVSTTLFRAVLNAGLPISERHAHAYRVYYYEEDSPPGLDATVYSPTTDLKFVNNTPGYILIQTKIDLKNLNLAFELYGTNDGRIVTLTKPVILSTTPPAEDLYQDDPTLPLGTLKQIEHKALGAKVVFSYKVELAGQTPSEKTFVSNYQPWQAVFLRGSSPIR